MMFNNNNNNNNVWTMQDWASMPVPKLSSCISDLSLAFRCFGSPSPVTSVICIPVPPMLLYLPSLLLAYMLQPARLLLVYIHFSNDTFETFICL
jgi:hypothetical protein